MEPPQAAEAELVAWMSSSPTPAGKVCLLVHWKLGSTMPKSSGRLTHESHLAPAQTARCAFSKIEHGTSHGRKLALGRLTLAGPSGVAGQARDMHARAGD